ncbi:MAG: hypothetical protein KKA79_04535 [Nanoarchaeota archaeon]|nr:hypothetical protein [Nanoarchaeota archaeon]
MTTFYSNVGYAYHNGKEEFPEVQILEEELSKYIRDNLKQRCNLRVFKDLEINTENRIGASASFHDKVILDVIWSITVTKDNTTFEYTNYKVSLPVRMGKIWEVMNDIVKNPEKAELVTNLKSQKDMTINRYYHENQQSIYIIRDHKSEIKDKDYYIFAFATK